MLRAKIVKDTIVLNLASVIRQLLAVAQSFFVMRFLVPDAFGVWLGLGIVLGYSAYVHLGVEFGMGLRLLYFRGRGDVQREAECEDSTFAVWTLLGLFFAAALVVYAISVPQPTTMRFGLLAVAVMVPAEQQVAYFGRWQSSARMDFNLGGSIAVARGVMAFCLIVPLAYFFGFNGVLGGAVASSLTTAAMWWWKSSYRFRRRVAAPMVKELFVVGFPVLLTSIGGMLLQTVDRVVIASQLGAASLGYYGATGLGGGLLLGVLYQAGSALSPHIVLEAGKSRGEGESLVRFLEKPTVVASYVASAGIMMLLFVVPAIVELALPRYRPGIPAIYGFLPGFYFLAIVMTASNVLAIILIERGGGRILSMVFLQAAAVLLEIGFALLFIRVGWDITGVAVASTLAYALYGCGIVTMAAFAVFSEPRRRVEFFKQIAIPFIYCGVVVVIGLKCGDYFASDALTQSAIGAALGTVALVPLAVLLDARVPFLRQLRVMVADVRARLFARKGAD